jgi:hypothetical protein
VIAAELSIPVYHADDLFIEHARGAKTGSTLARINAKTAEQIFLRDPEAMLADFIVLGQEEFPMILDDLTSKYTGGVVVEGCALQPSEVAASSREGDSAMFLVPTEEFQRREYSRRPWIHEVVSRTSDPGAAWENWRVRDAAYASFITDEAHRVGLPVILVDGHTDFEEVCSAVRRNHSSVTGV